MEYITKKFPREISSDLRELTAEYTLAEGRKVTEGEIMIRAMREFKAKPISKKKKHTFWDLYGSLKGGPKSNATQEIDDVVYGDVGRT